VRYAAGDCRACCSEQVKSTCSPGVPDTLQQLCCLKGVWCAAVKDVNECQGVWCGTKKCTAVLLGRSTRNVQALRVEVAPRTACGRSCAPGLCRPMCEWRSVRAGVQDARSREVFGCEQVECMGAVYSRADSRLSTRMHGECMGENPYVDRELSTQIHSRGLRKRGSVRA
jgi:hypothetical protein